MSKVTIDVAQESTLRNIYSKVEEGAGIWCKPEYLENQNIGNYVTAGIYEGSEKGTIVINFRNRICMISNNGDTIVEPGGLNHSWWTVCKLPFKVNVQETCFIVFNNKIHMLGGGGNRKRIHYKWDGHKWSIASELPYDFCNGKVIVYQNKLHIIGGGSTESSDTYGTGRLNKHYAWDGESWEKASDLPYPAWGCLPFVCNGKLHLIGGGICDDVNYNTAHYIWDGISWSKGTDIPFQIYNGSAARVSDDQIYVFGGRKLSGGSAQTIARLFNGSTWSNVKDIPVDAINVTGMAATVDANRNVVVSGKRLFTLSDGVYTAHMASPGIVTKGDIVSYRGELYIFCQTNHYKWTNTGWIKVSTIPYNFVGGSAVVYDDKINLLGSSSSGVEDYHYTWCPEDGWKLKSNLPEKFSNGSAVVFNNEIHIIGGTAMNGSTYNHYKLVNARWEAVGNTNGAVIGPKSTVAHDGLIYAVTQESNSECKIVVFDGIGWSEIGSLTINTSADKYKYLVVFQNRIHLFALISDDRIWHYIFTGKKTTIGHVVSCGYIQTGNVPCITVYGDRICIFSISSPTSHSIVFLQYAFSDVPLLKIYIPKNHQIICNKADLLPVIGQVEETDSGYRALTTGLYTFVNYTDNFTVS